MPWTRRSSADRNSSPPAWLNRKQMVCFLFSVSFRGAGSVVSSFSQARTFSDLGDHYRWESQPTGLPVSRSRKVILDFADRSQPTSGLRNLHLHWTVLRPIQGGRRRARWLALRQVDLDTRTAGFRVPLFPEVGGRLELHRPALSPGRLDRPGPPDLLATSGDPGDGSHLRAATDAAWPSREVSGSGIKTETSPRGTPLACPHGVCYGGCTPCRAGGPNIRHIAPNQCLRRSANHCGIECYRSSDSACPCERPRARVAVTTGTKGSGL